MFLVYIRTKDSDFGFVGVADTLSWQAEQELRGWTGFDYGNSAMDTEVGEIRWVASWSGSFVFPSFMFVSP